MGPSGLTRVKRLTVVVATAVVIGGAFAPAAAAHSSGDTVLLYNPLSDGDSDYSDVTARWATTPGTEPATHRCVYSNWGWPADWCGDIFGANRLIVSPFGTKTNTGHATRVTVVGVRAGCASGQIADGGYRVTLEVKDTVTGSILARAELMHVSQPQVGVGQTLGPWTTIGRTAQFRYSSCYQVSNSSGQHVHLEVTNYHAYACYVSRPNGANLTELTTIGKVGTHFGGQRARC